MKNIKLLMLILCTGLSMSACKKDAPSPSGSQNPAVVSKSEQNNAIGIPRNEAIAVTFNGEMMPSTINASTFFVMQGQTAVEGTITYSGTTATFTPLNILAANTTFTVTVTTGVKNSNGNSLANNLVWSFTTGTTSSTREVINLKTAANYVILAKTAVNNSPTSQITGDIGLSPAATSYITGFSLVNATGYATSSQVNGHVYAADMVTPTSINLTTAVNDMTTAYNDAAARPTPDFVELNTGNIGGATLSPGLYKWTSSVSAPTSLTISGGPNDVWIFQIAGNLSLSASVNITLSGGAQAKNIFWQVAGTVNIGTSAHMEGIVLSMTGITFENNASLNGRALAQTAVILGGSTITQP